MILTILSWATYYNTDHANPYNQPTELHFGMPEYMSNEYRLAFSSAADTCSRKLSLLYELDGKFFSSKEYIDNSRTMIESECDEIKCQWRQSCNKYSNITSDLTRLNNEDLRCQAESLLGFIKSLESHQDICQDYFEHYSDDDELFINYLILRYSHNSDISYLMAHQLFSDFSYYDDEDECFIEVADRDGEGSVPTREQIQQRMLQWATERSM